MSPRNDEVTEASGLAVVRDEAGVSTTNLPSLVPGQQNFRVQVDSDGLLREAEAFAHFVVAYLMRERRLIRDGETLGYGYWITKFVAASDKQLDTLELRPDGGEFVPGASLTLTYWRGQHAVCRASGAAFSPPRADRLVAVSAGVMEGDPTEGVRYPSPDHMSGWWFTTDRYDGNIRSLRVEHLYHVTAARPDLARLVALPYGYRFLLDGVHVWFDQKVASQPSK